MSVDIKTATIDPIRLTFDHVEARIGKGKAATRYQEGVFDMQMTQNFHYRPTWQPELELFDRRRTAIALDDFDQLLDPRQYYYAPYTMQRARQQETQEASFAMVEKRALLANLEPAWADRIRHFIVPLRHAEWGANTNNCFIAAYGYGAPMTSAAVLQAMDRLGIAQYLTRIALTLEGNDPRLLDQAKADWLRLPAWQPLRHLLEDLMVASDWFEVHLVQNFLVDGALFPLAYEHFDRAIAARGGLGYSLLTEFMREWHAESRRWTDATLRTAAAASADNANLLGRWAAAWEPRVIAAAMPLARALLDDGAPAALDAMFADLRSRRQKIGLAA